MSKPTITKHPDGTATVNLERIRSIGVHNIVDVVAHRVMRSDDETLHRIEFSGGGQMKLRYTTEGKVLEFKLSGLNAAITPDGDILLRRA